MVLSVPPGAPAQQSGSGGLTRAGCESHNRIPLALARIDNVFFGVLGSEPVQVFEQVNAKEFKISSTIVMDILVTHRYLILSSSKFGQLFFQKTFLEMVSDDDFFHR